MTEYNLPPTPGFFESYNPRVGEKYQVELELAKQRAAILQGQELNPLRGASLGEISQITQQPAHELATPGQIQRRDVTELSDVPSFKYMPTQPDVPQVSGLYDQRGGPQGFEYQVREMGQPTPSVRPAPQPLVPSPGQFQEQPARPDISYSKQSIDTGARSTLPQQLQGMSALERAEKWPRIGAGSGGANTKAYMIDQLTQGLMVANPTMTPEQAHAIAQQRVAGGGTQEEFDTKNRLKSQQADTSGARQANIEQDTRLDPQRFKAQEEERRWMHDFRNRSLTLRSRSEDRMQDALSRNDTMALSRLNEARYWHDKVLEFATAKDPFGLMDDEQKGIVGQALGILPNLDERAATPEEMGFFERFFGGPRKRYAYQGTRPPLPATKGTGAPMARQSQSTTTTSSFQGAPAGKNVGDTLKDANGKPVAKWDGKTWQPGQ